MKTGKIKIYLILILFSFCVYSPAAKADEVTFEARAINATNEFLEYDFTVTYNGQPVSGRHVVVPVTLGGDTFTILTAPSNFYGETSLIVPINAPPANMSQKSGLKLETSSNDYITQQADDPIGCCAEVFLCNGEICGLSCFSVYTAADEFNCALIGQIAPNINTAYHPGQTCVVAVDGTCQCEESTLVELSGINATPSNGSVVITWTTESEIDNAGFNIYRSSSEDGGYVNINDDLIPAEGSPTEGASYSFVDENVQNRATYFYKLEDVDINGVVTIYEPVSATPRLIYGIGK